LTQAISFALWDPGAGAPPLDGDGLHLWRIQTGPEGANTADLWPLLAPDEQVRARRLATHELQGRYVRAHAGLRLILGLYLDQSPQSVVLETSERGKPAVAAQPSGAPVRLEINLTGSHDLALVAVTMDYPVGVDCELIRPRPGLLGIARQMFPRQVADALECTPDQDRLAAFYAAWTALEAEVKADGRGLFGPRDPAVPPCDTAHFLPQPGYLAAVAREWLPAAHLWGAYEWSGWV
jgi:4'-phosphopantetheinyl transferase